MELPYSDDFRSHGRLVKPTRLDRLSAKSDRKKLIARAKLKQQRREMAAYSAFRKSVYARDGGMCRAYGDAVKLLTDNPLNLAHVHHITFKSAGGSDVLENCCILSPKAHALIHAHLLHCEGDAEDTLTFTLTDNGGAVVERWVSQVVPR